MVIVIRHMARRTISQKFRDRASNTQAVLTYRYIIAYYDTVTDRNDAPGKIIYLGTCLTAAVRLTREERWDNSPRVLSHIADAIQLAKRI